jgi:phenylacetate-CoA ligase
MGTYSFLMNYVTLPFYDLLRDTHRFKYSQILSETQWLSQQDIESIQRQNLQMLIKHAYETVPYYRRVFKQKGLSPNDIKCVGDLAKLPILTKDIVRKNARDLVSQSYPKKMLVPYRSGGSGDQVRFFITKEQLSWEIAAEYRAYGWAGYRFGDRCFMFWASPIDLSRYKKVQKRLAMALERVFIVDTYIISNEVLARFTDLLQKFNPEIVKGYASSVYLMAKYLVENGVNYVRPRAVITTAETLFDSMRATIENAFGCPVFDYYGSREVGGLAAECEKHSGYHISAENVAMEFMNEGESVAAGEKGVILVTSLRNYGMPFIRYKIGDVGTPAQDKCDCGRGLPLIKSIEGRVSDFMAVYDKRMKRIVPIGPMYPLIIIALMKVPLQSVRVVQETLDRVVIKAVKGRSYSSKHTDLLVNYLRKSLGDEIQIEFEFVDYIPPSPSGKRSTFVSKINPFDQH